MYEEVYTLAARWSDMCLALKLPISCQEMIEADHRGDSARCLQTVLVKWLQKDYNHSRHGPPTWRSLVKAVDNPAGGNNCALAEAVAKKHLGMYIGAVGRLLEVERLRVNFLATKWLAEKLTLSRFAPIPLKHDCASTYRNLPKISPPSKIHPPPFFE